MTDTLDETDRRAQEVERHQRELDRSIDELRRQLSPGQLLDQVLNQQQLSGMGANFRSFADNLGRSARDNPLPITLLGLGLAWTMLSSPRGDDGAGEPHARGAWDGEDAPAVDPGSAEEPRRFTEDIARYGVGPHEADAEPAPSAERISAAEAAAETVERRADESEDAFQHRRDRVRARVLNLRERAGEGGAQLRSRIDASVARARRGAGNAGHQLRGGASRAGRRASAGFDQQPLAAAAIAVGVGAALAAMLPATRTEDERLGPYREGAEAAAKRRVQETLDEGDARATAAYRAARDQAVGPRTEDAPGQSAHSIAGKV